MKPLVLLVASLLVLAPPAAGRPADRFSDLRPEIPDLGIEAPAPGGGSLSSHIFGDTVSYGGTYWAPRGRGTATAGI